MCGKNIETGVKRIGFWSLLCQQLNKQVGISYRTFLNMSVLSLKVENDNTFVIHLIGLD